MYSTAFKILNTYVTLKRVVCRSMSMSMSKSKRKSKCKKMKSLLTASACHDPRHDTHAKSLERFGSFPSSCSINHKKGNKKKIWTFLFIRDHR